MINSKTRTSRAGKQRPAPLSIRVSEDQRAALLSRAGHQLSVFTVFETEMRFA
ncbi:MAG: hypothetical protein RLZ98_2355 [Pseudomonadota bacterium]|jgi:hypothetical protein